MGHNNNEYPKFFSPAIPRQTSLLIQSPTILHIHFKILTNSQVSNLDVHSYFYGETPNLK